MMPGDLVPATARPSPSRPLLGCPDGGGQVHLVSPRSGSEDGVLARSLCSPRHNDILFDLGDIVLELSHQKIWLPLTLCISEWNAGFAIGI